MNIGVIGSGTMGNGIAHVFSMYKHKVILIDVSNDILENALNTIKNNMNRQLKKGIISSNDMDNAIRNITTSIDINKLKNCNLVVEAVKEDYNVKAKIFNSLNSVCNNKTIFASNTSSISIKSLSKNVSAPDKFIGMHFMNPVPVMKLVEIIKGEDTSSKTVDFVNNLSKSIDKIPIECNDSPGFVSNRILMPMINEAAFCYMEGVANAEAIDAIMHLGMGHPMGPLKLADLIGIDVCVYIMKVLYEGFNNEKYKVCPILEKMISENKLGKKTKEGFYKYEF